MCTRGTGDCTSYFVLERVCVYFRLRGIFSSAPVECLSVRALQCHLLECCFQYSALSEINGRSYGREGEIKDLNGPPRILMTLLLILRLMRILMYSFDLTSVLVLFSFVRTFSKVTENTSADSRHDPINLLCFGKIQVSIFRHST